MTHRLLPILAFLLTVLTTGYGQDVPGKEPKKPGPGVDTLKVPPTQQPESLNEAGVNPPTLQNFLPLSPSSAAQARYGEYPVSLFTGLPTIQIPLYEVKTPRFALPLALSYHASGIKVTDAANWVGLGWSLQGGGAVRRRVRGLPDENSQGILSSPLNRSIPQDCSQDDDDELALQLMYNTNNDSEPDEFMWSLPNGKSGKFYYRSGRGFVMQPLSAVRVNSQGGLDSFTLTDTDGSLYRFGRSLAGAKAKESTDVNNPGKTYSYPTTAWMLTEMISADKSDTLSFQYSESFSSQTDLVEQITFFDEGQGTFVGKQSPLSGEVSVIRNIATSFYEQNLTTILFRNGRVQFVKDNADPQNYGSRERLRQVVVQQRLGDGTYTTIQSHRLVQGYYASSNHSEKRLRLDSLLATDRTGQTVYRHGFGYNALELPEHSSPSRDYWGYYNHKSQPYYGSRMPPISIPYNFAAGSAGLTTIGTANRTPDSTYMKAGVLVRIEHPTGGNTTFDYEPNFYEVDGPLKMAGGLRIRRLGSLAGDGSPETVKHYGYSLADDSLSTVSGFGRLNANTLNSDWTTLRDAFESANYVFRKNYTGTIGEQGSYRVRVYSSDPNMGLTGTENAPVVYPKVVEYAGDPPQQQGYTVHVFNDFGDNYGPNNYPSLRGLPGRMEDFSWRRGKPLTTYFYNQSNTLLKKIANVYADSVAHVDSVGVLIHRAFINDYSVYLANPSCPIDPNDRREYFHAYYTLTTGIQQLASSTETDYPSSGGGPSATRQMTYAYDPNYYLPKQKEEKDSRGDTYRTTYAYPFDYATGVYPRMKQRRIIERPVAQTLYHDAGGTWRRLSLDSLHFEALKPAFATDTMFMPTRLGQSL